MTEEEGGDADEEEEDEGEGRRTRSTLHHIPSPPTSQAVYECFSCGS